MKHLATASEHFAWPVAAIIMLLLVIRYWDRLAKPFQRLPTIRKIKLANFEIELSRENYDQVKIETNKQFSELINKTDAEILRFARTVDLSSYFASLCNAIYRLVPPSSKANPKSALRLTAYIFDPIFEDQLYQIVHYFRPETSRFSTDLERGPGRRFSIRYGIIGRAARSESTAIILDAFTEATTREELILEWSMTPDQAAAAESKKSCLALAAKDPSSGGLLGIVYADAEISEYFCSKSDKTKFIQDIEKSKEFENFSKTLADLQRLTCQVELKFNLVNIGRK